MKNLQSRLFLAFAFALILALSFAGCGGGGGGGGSAVIDQQALRQTEGAAVRNTVLGFLSAINSSNPSAASGFCSRQIAGATNLQTLVIHTLGADLATQSASYTFFVDPNEIVYLTSDMAIVTAFNENIGGSRFVLKFTLIKEGGIWLIDNIEPTLTTLSAPAITSIAPSSGVNTGSLNLVTILGTGFKTGVTVQLTRTGQTPVSATNIVVATDGASLTCTLPLLNLLPGPWSVVVTNLDSQSATRADLFTVLGPVPTITSIDPNSAQNIVAVNNVTLTGTGFQTGAVVTLARAGQASATATNVAVAGNGLSLTCTLPVASLLTGSWDVVLRNPDGQSVTRAELFTVIPAEAPLLSDVQPLSGAPGTTVVLHGASLGTGGTLKIGSVSITEISQWTDQQITFVVPSGVTVGIQNIVVTPAGSQSSAQLPFTVVVWTAQNLQDVYDLKSIDLDGTDGWIVGGNRILQSTDSGLTWNPVTDTGVAGDADLRGVLVRSGKVMIVGQSMGAGYYLTNNGGTWSNDSSVGALEWCAVAGLDTQTNLVLGGQYMMNPTDAAGQIGYPNAGGGWLYIGQFYSLPDWASLPIPFLVRAISTPDGHNYWAVGDIPEATSNKPVGLAKSTDDGHTWTTPSSYDPALPDVSYTGVDFVDTQNGWAVGGGGTIIHTTDGGLSWTQQTVPAEASDIDLNAVDFVDASYGWAVGNGGTILTTTNGGTTWTLSPVPLGMEASLRGVKFSSRTNGWVVGTQGTILRTTTGGR